MKSRQQNIKRVVWVRLKHGDDLLKTLSDFCLENNIRAGLVSAIGALQKARFGFYDQAEKKYQEINLPAPVELISCLGNVSIKEGKPFVHAHISVGDGQGKVFGGHLYEGCIVFAGECSILELEGKPLERKLDRLTGLSLWDFSG